MPRSPPIGAAATPPRVGAAAEGIPASFGDAIGIVRRFLDLDDVPPKQLLLRARQELELTEQDGTMRQQLQSILKEIGRDDIVFTRSPAVDPPSPPAALSAEIVGGPKPRPQTVLRQAVLTAELQQLPQKCVGDMTTAATAAINEKKKLESLVQKMIVKHQHVLAERTVEQDARARAEEELARLRNEKRELDTDSQVLRCAELEQTIRDKEMELARLQGKIKKLVGAAKGELEKKQAHLAAKESASDVLQLRLATQRASCVSALQRHVNRALRTRCFYEWVRRSASLVHLSMEDSASLTSRSAAEIPDLRNLEVLCDKFRSLVSGTFAGQRACVLFNYHDHDQDGRWSWDDFCRAVRSSAHVTDFAMSDDELQVVFDCRDENGVGLITMEQLQSLVSCPLKHISKPSPQRRMKPPSKKQSVAMTQLRRTAVAANRRVHELEAAAEHRAVLVAAMKRWTGSAAFASRARAICKLLLNLRHANLVKSGFGEWARTWRWKQRALRVVLSCEAARRLSVVRSTFARWVAWRERLAMERLGEALKTSQKQRQSRSQLDSSSAPASNVLQADAKPEATDNVTRHSGHNKQYPGTAVRARKQLQARVEAANQEAAEAHQRAEDLALALKHMTVKLQKSEAAVVELSDLVAFSHYGGQSTAATTTGKDDAKDLCTPLAASSGSRDRLSPPKMRGCEIELKAQSIQTTKSTSTKQTKRRQTPSVASKTQSAVDRKPPASNPTNISVSLRTESSGQKLGFILDKRSSAPCSIAKVTRGGLADKASIRPGYSLIAVQGQSLEDCKYSEVVSAIRKAASSPRRTLELVVRAPVAELNYDGRSTRRAGVSSRGAGRGNTQHDGVLTTGHHNKSKSCPELVVKSAGSDEARIAVASSPTSKLHQTSAVDKAVDLCLSPITPLGRVATAQTPQPCESGSTKKEPEQREQDVETTKECSHSAISSTAPCSERSSLNLELAETEEDGSPVLANTHRPAPVQRWAEVVDPFACLKERGPATCATSAKEALHSDSCRKSMSSDRPEELLEEASVDGVSWLAQE